MDICLKNSRYSVYPYDGNNLEEILCKFYEAIKECNDLSLSLKEFNEWLLSEGIGQEVLKQLNNVDWDNIVNNDLYQQVVTQINNINGQIDNFATKEQLGNYATIEQLGNYATTSYVDGKYDDLFQFVSNGKTLIASAITDMGVDTSNNDTFQVMADNIRKINPLAIAIGYIGNMSVNQGRVFTIIYNTTVEAVKHEMSFDGGNTFHVIYPSGNKNAYYYDHEAINVTEYPHQRIIRVTDRNGNSDTSNIFNIYVTDTIPFLASMYGNPRIIPDYPEGIQFPPINAHEDKIQPHGVNSTDSWRYGTRINYNPREDWTRVGWWGQIYRQEGYGSDPDNVAVEVKNAKLWGWNGSSWVLIHDVNFTETNTIFYVENFANDQNNQFASNKKVDGSKTVTVKFDSTNSGYMFHPYSGKAKASDFGLTKPYYYCSTISARLVKWDNSGADNLDSAKLCFNVGGDYWHTTHDTWQPDWSANGEYAQGQFIKCTREWRTAYCTNVPEGWTNGFPTVE